MLVKSARRYINTLDKILKNQHNDIITEITEDDDMDIFSVTLKFHIDGLYCFVAAYNNDDNVLYYVEGNGRAVTYIISDNETQKESMYTILNRIYDIVARLATETSEIEEVEEVEETTTHDTIETLPPYNCNNCNKKVRTDSFYGMFGGFPSISEMYNDKCFRCPADRPRNRCCGEKWCAETWKRYSAIVNPEWHHVSLATLADIDFDMLDEKRKVYLSFYKKWKEVCKNLKKCSCGYSYERCYNAFRRSLTIALAKKKISKELVEYFDRQISMSKVECGVWSSAVEEATGQHESRKYNRATLRY